MQLDACLRTFALNCADSETCQKRVIFKCTDSRHAAQYATLREGYPDVEFIAESDFHQNLEAALSGFEYVLFMVDDNLCVHPFRIGEIVSALDSETSAIAFSLRLGRNIELCYSHNDTPQKMPEAVEILSAETDRPEDTSKETGKILRFPWVGADYDFGYPMEVSSSVFRVHQILFVLPPTVKIKQPNALEERLDAAKGRFAQSHPYLLCFEYSAAFCNPLNVVQYNYLNRAAFELDSSVNSLVERFELGFRFDVREFAGFRPKGCHQEKEMGFLPPSLEWDKLHAGLKIEYTGSATKSGGEIAPEALECDLNARTLPDDSLQSVLVALHLVNPASGDPSVSWMEAMGKRHREKLTDRDTASAKAVAALKERLSHALKLSGEQGRANAEQGKEIAALQQEVGALRPALAGAQFELEQIRQKRWYILLNDASNRFWSMQNRLRDFVTRLRNCKLRDVKSLLNIDDTVQFSDRQFHVRGWLVIKKASAAAMERLGAFHLLGNHPKGARASIGSFITLQSFCDGKWLALVRFSGATEPPSTQDLWPKEKPLVSIVIPCHNSGKLLMDAVDSALAQTWQDLEVIVVDQGSDDAETIRVIEDLRLSRTRVIRQQNSKIPNARNTGIATAAGKYICCLDASDKLEPAYIEKCLLRLIIEGFGICGIWRGNPGFDDGAHALQASGFARALGSNGLIHSAVFPRQLWESAVEKDAATADRGEDRELWIHPTSQEANVSDSPDSPFIRRTHGPTLVDAAKARFNAVARRIRARFGGAVPGLKARTLRRSQWREILSREMSAEKIRVLLCLPYLTIGGAEKILSQICRGLTDEGFHFTVITTKRKLLSQGDSAEWFRPSTSEIFCLPECLSQDSWNGFISYLISSRRVDILLQAGSTHVYDLLPELKTLFPELKVVDNLFNEVGHTANNRKYDYLIDLHIVESSPIRSWLLARGENADRIRLIPNGVELSRFNTGKRPTPPFDTGGRKFIVGFFGRLSKEKGPDLFVEIAEHLKSEKDILFVIGGHGAMEDKVREQIAARGLEDSVKLLGFCEVETHLSCCDLLALPSRQDGRPNVVMEAMAMGIPVIASRVGGLAELVLDGYSGFLCDALDTRQFSETILMLSKDPVRCEKLRAGARLHAGENFDIRKSVAAFSEAFHELLCKRSPAQLMETTVQ
jgi:glycosyltransferase involved in cell wall biosynthesis